MAAIIAISIFGPHFIASLSDRPNAVSVTTPISNTTTSVPRATTADRQHAQLIQEVTYIIDHRQGNIEVAVQDLTSGVTTTFGAENPQDEASVVKVNILAALLSPVPQISSLSAQARILAPEMIEASNNDAATSLWNSVGGTSGITSFDSRIGLTATTPSACVQCAGFPWPGWGLTTTTPIDEIKLLKAALVDDTYLSSQDRTYELQLMESVTPSERWGISNGVVDSAAVALKNGWLPLNSAGTDWQINSVGWVRGDGRDYLIAMFSTGNPSEDYGIQTLNSISLAIWNHLDN